MTDINASLRKIAKGAGIILIGILISKLFSYFFRLLIARYGVADYGLISIASTVITFIMIICTLGLDKGILRYVSFFVEKKEIYKIKGTLLSSLKFSAILSIIATVLLFIFSEPITTILFPNSNIEKLSTILKIMSIMIPFSVFTKVFNNFFRAMQKPRYEVYTKNIAESLTKLFVAAVLFYIGVGIYGIAGVFVLAFVLSAVLGFIFTIKIFPKLVSKKIVPEYINKELLSYSVPLIFAGIFATILAALDILMIGYFKNEIAAGIYNAVVPTAQLMFVLPLAILTLFLPVLTEFYVKKENDKFLQIYKVVSKWIFMTSLLLLGMFIVYSKEILSLLFGKDFGIGWLALIILASGYFINYVFYPSESIIMILKKSKLIFYNSVIISILNIILNYILIPKYGFVGAAIATSVSFALWGTILFIESYYYTKMIPFKKSLIKIALSGMLCSILFFHIKNLIAISNVIYLLLFLILFAIIYFVFLLATNSFEHEDKMIVQFAENKIGIKIPLLSRLFNK